MYENQVNLTEHKMHVFNILSNKQTNKQTNKGAVNEALQVRRSCFCDDVGLESHFVTLFMGCLSETYT